jgi:hypothetical protein
VKVSLIEANRGRDAISAKTPTVVGLDGAAPDCAAGAIESGGIVKCETSGSVPLNARATEPYWKREGEAGRYVFEPDAPFGRPFRPTPFKVRFDLTLSGVDVPVELPVAFRYEGNIFSGEKRMDLLVVPAITVKLAPDIVIVPTGTDRPVPTAARDEGRTLKVIVTHNAPGPAEADVTLDVPEGWRVNPEKMHVAFERPDEVNTVAFRLSPPATLTPGSHKIAAKVISDGKTFTRGFDVIEYPHIRREHVFSDAVASLKVLDVRLPAGLTIGYIMGVGDQVPAAIEQLGATVRLLGPDDLASGDLSRYDAIVTGVRAYERRKDLRAYNHRLIEYARGGGTLIVQYNKFEFNQAQYGPYPAKVSSDRVTDEHAPVKVLVPDHPVFTRPNRIGPEAWEHWVQERGLYFLGERDSRYVDLVESADPFPMNPGAKRGALVEAPVGKGRWVYVGLNLWRQLPAGTEGAYELLANLLSLGTSAKATASAH